MIQSRSFADPAAGRKTARPALILLLLGGLCMVAGPVAAQLCEGATPIARLGGPNRFSPPVEDQEALETLFLNRRAEIVALLEEAKWTGDPDALFAAVAGRKGVRSITFDPGQRFHWMFFRTRGKPEVRENLCWSGSDAPEAWEISFVSNGRSHTMLVPESCGNLALVSERAIPAATLDLDAESLSCSARTFDFSSSCSYGEPVVTVRMPDGSEKSAGAGDVSFPFTDEGDYTVTATCSVAGSGDVTQDAVSETLAVGCPSCTVTASPAAVSLGEASTLTVMPKAGHGQELARVLLDGEPLASPYTKEMTHTGADVFTHTVVVETGSGQRAQCSTELQVAPTVTLTIDPDRTLAHKPAVVQITPEVGDGAPAEVTLDGTPIAAPYTTEISNPREGDYDHVAAVENAGGRSEATASMKVDPRWTLFASISDISGDDTQVDRLSETVRQEVMACRSGVGLGIGFEYKMNYRLGLLFGADLGRCETVWKYDVGDRRGRDMVDVDTNLLYAGLNFHLTRPGSRVDFWVGPIVGQFDYESLSLRPTPTQGMPIDAVYKPAWEDETVLGANLGLKVPFTRDCPVGLYLGAMWLDSTLAAPAAAMAGADGARAPSLSLDRNVLHASAGITIDF